MALLLNYKNGNNPYWRDLLKREIPDLDVRIWPDVGNRAEIEFALIWLHELGDLKTYPNLKAILSLGAGVDHILRDPDRPAHVPIVRLVDAALESDMAMYVIHWVIHYHRNFHRFSEFQRIRRWDRLSFPDTGQRKVGVMGLGQLGSRAAQELRRLGFDVAGWARTPKAIEGVRSYVGADGLTPFLNRTEILVLIMPATPKTTGIINRTALAALPQGAAIINPARGALIVDEDLVAALDAGHIGAATLDVFRTEPLPAESPYWTHPKVTVTPHAAGPTNDRSAAKAIAANIRRVLAGEKPSPVMDPLEKY